MATDDCSRRDFLRLSSVDGRLDVTMRLAYLKTTLNGKPVTLRNMYGIFPAPTLRVNAGDKLRILLVNQLPANPPSTEPVTRLHYPNSTNLHTHGLHVTPPITDQELASAGARS